MPKALVKLYKLFIDHGMPYQLCVEVRLLRCSWQFTMQQSVATVCKVTLLCQIINVVSVAWSMK